MKNKKKEDFNEKKEAQKSIFAVGKECAFIIDDIKQFIR